MKILLLILLLAFIVMMWRSQRLEKLWRDYQERERSEGNATGRFRNQSSAWASRQWARIRPEQPQPVSSSHFAAWVNQSLPLETETKLWFQSLSPEHLAVLTQFVDEFCQSMGFELNWLLDEQVAENRNLEQTLTAVVQHYLEACWLTFAVREDLLAFSHTAQAGTPEPEAVAARTEMEQTVKTKLRQNGKTAEFNAKNTVGTAA